MAAIARDEVGEGAFLLDDVMDTSTQGVLAKVRTLRKLGYWHCVVTSTYYLTQRCGDEVLRLFDACANHAGTMGIVAYNIPQCLGYAMPPDTLLDRARRGWVRTVKESRRAVAGRDQIRSLSPRDRFRAGPLRGCNALAGPSRCGLCVPCNRALAPKLTY